MVQLREYVENEYEYVVKCMREKSNIYMIKVNDNFDKTDYITLLSPFFPPVLSNIIIKYCTDYSSFILTPLSPLPISVKHDYILETTSMFFATSILTLYVKLTPNSIEVVHKKSIDYYGLPLKKFSEAYANFIVPWLTQLQKK